MILTLFIKVKGLVLPYGYMIGVNVLLNGSIMCALECGGSSGKITIVEFTDIFWE